MAKLVFDLVARDKATGEVNKLKASLQSLTTSKGWQSAIMGIGIGAGVGAFNAAITAIQSVGDALVSAVKDAAEEEAGIQRLGAALRANVPAWDGNTAAIEKTIASRRRFAFSDDELRQSFGSIVAATHDVNQAFEIQKTAMDLARFKGISLAEASDALVKVEAGQYRVLKSLGIVLGENATQTEALTAVQKVAGGQAEAYGTTASAALARFDDSVKELSESIGNRLLPVLTPTVNLLTDLIDGQTEWEQSAGKAELAARLQAAALGDLAHWWKYVRYEQSLTSDYPPIVTPPVEPPKFDAAKWEAARKKAADNAKSIADAIAASLADGEDNVTSAMQTLVDRIKNSVPAAKRAARLVGLLSSAEVANGLKSGDPYVRDAAQKLVATAKDELIGLGYAALALGYETSKMLAKGLYRPGGNEMIGGALNALKEYKEFLGKASAGYAWPKPDTGTTDKVADYAKTVRGAISALKGLGPTATSLVATFSSAWKPAIVTVAQAQTSLTAATTRFGDALARLRPGVSSSLSAVKSAFGSLKQAATTYYDLLHAKNLRSIQDARDEMEARFDAQIAQLQGGVDEMRKALQAQRDAREEAQLRADVANAATDDERTAAQQRLTDFLADQEIQRAQDAVDEQVKQLNAQRKTEEDKLSNAESNENARYETQKAGFDKLFGLTETQLESIKGVWGKKNAEVLKLLNSFTGDFQAAGKAIMDAFNAGLAMAEPPAGGSGTEPPPGRAVGGPVYSGSAYVVGERGPELFVPGSSGRIVPNDALSSSGGSVNVNVVVQGAALFDPYGNGAAQLANALLPGLKRALARNGMSLA